MGIFALVWLFISIFGESYICCPPDDGLGRLIAKEFRESLTGSDLRREDYYYDGIRRIHDEVRQPTGYTPPDPCTGLPNVSKNVSHQVNWVQTTGASFGPVLPACAPTTPSPIETPEAHVIWVDRQYVYGPNDVDEFIGQIDRAGDFYYMIQDAGLNVVALVDESGVVRRQDVYSPYGEVAASDHFAMHNHLMSPVGYKGLFFDRFVTRADYPPLTPGADGLYQNRNRSYIPRLGRFAQRDPNASSNLILEAIAMNGEGMGISSLSFELENLCGDGMNLFQFVGSNPITGSDPLGLSANFDWDAETEDLESELVGHRLYALGEMNEGAKWASLGMNATLTIAATVLGLDVLESAYLLASGQGGLMAGLDVLMSINPGARLAKGVGKLAKLRRMAKGTANTADAIHDLAKTARQWQKGYNQSVLAQAKAQYPKLANKKDELHHIIPKYLGGPENGPKVRVNPAYHQMITNEFRKKWAYGQGQKPNPQQLEEILEEVYSLLPLPH
jgi:hypothetical protein